MTIERFKHTTVLVLFQVVMRSVIQTVFLDTSYYGGGVRSDASTPCKPDNLVTLRIFHRHASKYLVYWPDLTQEIFDILRHHLRLLHGGKVAALQFCQSIKDQLHPHHHHGLIRTLACLLNHTRFPVVAAQLLGIGAISLGFQE
jgi:hypothetical protein